MSWNKIDLNSSFRRTEDEQEHLKFNLEDDEGNSLIKETENVTVNQEDDEADDVVVENKKETAKEDAKEEEDKKPQNKSRAQERIRELVTKNKEIEAKYQNELQELRTKLSSVNKDSLATQKDFIEARIVETKKALSKSQEEGKFDEATEYMSQLTDLQTKKIVVESTVVKEDKPEPAAKAKEFDDTELHIWAVKNREWWQKDAVKTQLAISLSKKIDKEGLLTPDSPEYFEELSERINEFWGEEDMKEDLQSSGKDEAKGTKKPPQTTSGASRTPSVKSKKPVISLTKEEQAMARKLGLTNLDWAKQKYKQMKNTDENGYQVIFDN
jgi:hypothetical protein